MIFLAEKTNLNIKELIEKLSSFEYNKSKISQTRLDLSNGRNKNFFTYKGQFSPDLVANLLKTYAVPGDTILDPFLGCGTVIYEATKQNLSAFGTEINPVAIYMAKIADLISLPQEKRIKLIREVNEVINDKVQQTSIYESMIKIINLEKNDYKKIILINILLSFKKKKQKTIANLIGELLRLSDFLKTLPCAPNSVGVFQADARKIPILNESVDLVITSPPYINVFNYHQYNRKLMEDLGWDILKIAKAEFGSNRKNRQNRFLTVGQYTIDMYQTFSELKRTLKSDGRIIFVVGKSTKVRGVDFYNANIIATIGLVSGFSILDIQERKFKNEYGQVIYEILIHFGKQNAIDLTTSNGLSLNNAIEFFLKDALNRTSDPDKQDDIEKAILEIPKIDPSPILNFE